MDSPLIENTTLVLVGPTAVGKTRLSLLLAELLPLEVVSADSRQVFRYLDIGTAKPGGNILKSIVHHFVDILNPDEPFSAGIFGAQARVVCEDILSRKKMPLLVGGSGLYVKAFLEGFFGGDVRDEKIRESLQQRLEREGPEVLHRDLARVDPEAAGKIHPKNSQRLLRALEVFLSSGSRISELQKNEMSPPPFQVLKFGLTMERKALYRRINNRVDQMFKDGLLAEVARLLEMGYEKNLNSLNSVGYKESIQYLEGKLTYEECVNLIKQNSRRFAKRQFTWFKADEEIRWFEINTDDDIIAVAGKIADICRTGG